MAWRAYSVYDTVTSAAGSVDTLLDLEAPSSDRAFAGAELASSLLAGRLGRDAVRGAKQASGRLQISSSGKGSPPAIKALSPNQMNAAIARGLAPRGIKRIDTGKVKGEQTHATFGNRNGKDVAALNKDGTWKHGEIELTKKQEGWLKQNGWVLPRERSSGQ